jgi:hypothetical protein
MKGPTFTMIALDWHKTPQVRRNRLSIEITSKCGHHANAPKAKDVRRTMYHPERSRPISPIEFFINIEGDGLVFTLFRHMGQPE